MCQAYTRPDPPLSEGWKGYVVMAHAILDPGLPPHVNALYTSIKFYGIISICIILCLSILVMVSHGMAPYHTMAHPEAAWSEALQLTGYDDGNTKSNTLYWIASRYFSSIC